LLKLATAARERQESDGLTDATATEGKKEAATWVSLPTRTIVLRHKKDGTKNFLTYHSGNNPKIRKKWGEREPISGRDQFSIADRDWRSE